VPPDPNNYSQEQRDRFRAAWTARSDNRRFGLFLFIALMVLWALSWAVAPDVMNDLPNSVSALLLGAPALLLIWYLRRQNRCPACKVVVSTDTKVRYCPSCGIQLE